MKTYNVAKFRRGLKEALDFCEVRNEEVFIIRNGIFFSLKLAAGREINATKELMREVGKKQEPIFSAPQVCKHGSALGNCKKGCK